MIEMIIFYHFDKTVRMQLVMRITTLKKTGDPSVRSDK